MSESYFGCITIPKLFITSKVEEVMKQDGLDNSYIESEDEYIVTYSNDEARNGNFESLEFFLSQKNIPFNRYSGGYYEYMPEHRYRRPIILDDGSSYDIYKMCTTDGSDYVPANPIKNILAEENLTLEDIQKKLTKLLNAYAPDSIELDLYNESNLGIVSVLLTMPCTNTHESNVGDKINYYLDMDKLVGEGTIISVQPEHIEIRCLIFSEYKRRIINDIIEEVITGKIETIQLLKEK